MILGSKTHTAGNTTRWIVDYSRWLANTATIVSADITLDSSTLTADTPTVLGREVVFFIRGGEVGETVVAAIVMVDSFGNTKNDSIHFTCIAP